MSDYQKRTRDIAIILGVICFALYMFRLWPLILVVILVGGVVLLKRVLFPQKEIQEKQEEPMQQPVIPNVYDDQSVWDKKYEFAVEKISCLVAKEYPNAKWIWESANWKEFFQKDEEVYIRLNKDGDYKRARIAIQDGFVTTMEILIEEQSIEEAPKPIPASSQDESVRIAFEWVEEHLLELNERCNEIIGQGKNELVLSASELPEEKCWENICKELIKAGLEQINILPGEGIQILLK